MMHYKTFIVESNTVARVFVTVSHFHPSLMYVGKAKSLPIEWSPLAAVFLYNRTQVYLPFKSYQLIYLKKTFQLLGPIF